MEILKKILISSIIILSLFIGRCYAETLYHNTTIEKCEGINSMDVAVMSYGNNFGHEYGGNFTLQELFEYSLKKSDKPLGEKSPSAYEIISVDMIYEDGERESGALWFYYIKKAKLSECVYY